MLPPLCRIFDPVRLFHVVDDERRLLRQAGRQQSVLTVSYTHLLRLEASLVSRSRNISSYHGKQLAYQVEQEGESYTALRPLYYMDLEGNVYNYDDAAANDPVLKGFCLLYTSRCV